jgi:hypothetical protein
MLRFPTNPSYGQVFHGARRTWVYREGFWDVLEDDSSDVINTTLTKNAVTVVGAPIGEVDGINKDFILPHLPLAGTLQVYYNGLLQKKGETYDYTDVDRTVSFIDPPHADSTLTVIYDRLSSMEILGEVPVLDECHCEGSSPKYNLQYAPDPASIKLYLNGLLKKLNEDYTINENSISFTYSFPPEMFLVQVYYRVNL